jgi:sugar lactone lactonase YvrE
MNQVQAIYNGHAELAEGPVWHEGALWWVNITAGTLNRLDLDTGHNASRGIGEYLGCAVPAPGEPGIWWLAGQQRLLRLDWNTGHLETLNTFPAMPPSLRLNDGKLDPRGRFWVGTLSLKGELNRAALLRRDIDGSIQTMVEDVSLSNGMTWSASGERFFYIDTPTHEVTVYDYDLDAGTLSNRQVLSHLDSTEGFPDGMCAGLADDLYVAMWGGAQILRLCQRTGQILDRIPVPVSQPSSVCLIPGDTPRLAITTAWQGLPRDPLSGPTTDGSIFVVDLK